jgi:hypothetical protein
MKYLVATLLFIGLFSPAQARHLHTVKLDPMCNITMPCELPVSVSAVRESQRVARGKYVARQVGFGGVTAKRIRPDKISKHSAPLSFAVKSAAREPYEGPVRRAAPDSRVVEHPSGCPQRAFCGCGAAVRVFGSPIKNLWAAAAWYKFPRSSPAPGTVAVRPHHVMVLEADLGGGVWQVYDANSGRHATRVHAKSIRGYTIVSPR